jgi:hypothetical protein
MKFLMFLSGLLSATGAIATLVNRGDDTVCGQKSTRFACFTAKLDLNTSKVYYINN